MGASKETKWLRNLLLNTKLWPCKMSSISLYWKNEAPLFRSFSELHNKKFNIKC